MFRVSWEVPVEGWRNVMYLGRRLGARFVAVLAPSLFQGGRSFDDHVSTKLFNRPFILKYRGPSVRVSLRPEYGKVVVACARRAQALPTLSMLNVGIGAIFGLRKSDNAMKEVGRAAVRRGGGWLAGEGGAQ